jgi:hypothetical protein
MYCPLVSTAETRTCGNRKLQLEPPYGSELETLVPVVILNYSQEHSWHQLSCDAGIQDASHEKHTLNEEARYPQYQGHHCDQGKPEYDEKEELTNKSLLNNTS